MEFSGHGLKFCSVQRSIATSRNRLVVYMIHMYMHMCENEI